MAREPFNPDRAVGGAGSLPGARPGPPAERVLTVAEVTQRVKQAVESALPPTIHVAGELSNFKRHTNGHLYFTLKDETSELACVMWRSDAGRVKFDLQDGMDVIVTGGLNVFERAGRYQLYARRIEPRGVGAMELAFRQLCEKLRKEGLFDAQHKQPIPAFPQCIAVVTSPTGAAVEDILNTLARRYACAQVLLYPVTVQGPGAAAAIVRAIRELNRRREALGGIDVMIVGRGGGSAEDLAAFNDEGVARAIFASEIPVISAVGHETDTSISDLVADVRAATPTAAAELATPRTADVLEEFAYRANRLTRGLRHLVELRGALLASAGKRRPLADPAFMVAERAERLERAARRSAQALRERLHRGQLRVQELAVIVQRMHPQRVLLDRQARLAGARHRVEHAWHQRIRLAERGLARQRELFSKVSPVRELSALGSRVADLDRRLKLALAGDLKRRTQAVGSVATRLAAMGYRATLKRGFSITRCKRSGRVIRQVADVAAGEKIVTEVADGTFDARVLEAGQGELFD